jgi:transcriptional regulator GlxA family with amidase domain
MGVSIEWVGEVCFIFHKKDYYFRNTDMIAPPHPPFRIGFLLVDGFALMSYSAAVEPLRAANHLGGRRLYDWVHIPAIGAQAVTSGGLIIPGDAPLGGQGAFDLLLVVAGGDPVSYRNAQLFSWLRRLARAQVALGGVSGGPAILARAGVMQGYRMTIHWEHAAALAELEPDLAMSRALYVVDRGRITCAGGIAPLDMMHALIASHHGGAFARDVSDWFMHTDIRPSWGPQKAGIVERYNVSNPILVEVIDIMQNHIADPLNLTQLGQLSGRTGRQLNRLFRDHIGQSTMGFYRDMRLLQARRLLSQTPLSVTEIAYATGFSSGAHFSQSFSAKFGQPPASLRERLPAEPDSAARPMPANRLLPHQSGVRNLLK